MNVNIFFITHHITIILSKYFNTYLLKLFCNFLCLIKCCLFTDTSLEMTELLKLLIKTYFKTRDNLQDCFILMINKEETMKEQQVKDDMLCKYWYSMVDTPEKIVI